MRTVLLTLLVVALIIVAAYFFVVYSGVISIAAHPEAESFVAGALDKTMDHSVEHHAASIKVPPLDDPALIRAGAHEYAEACVLCHGAPGKEPEEFTQGMDPTPPEYEHIGKEMSPNVIFWIAKHGIMMSGMPTFQKESDQTLWGVVALMKKLPNMTPAEYQALTAESGEQQHLPGE